jgi:hypothetical protein
LAGVRGDDLAGVQRSKRSAVSAAPASSSSALVVHAQREGNKRARSPGTGKGRCPVNAGKAGLAVFARDGRPMDRDAQRLNAQRNIPVRRSRMRPGIASTSVMPPENRGYNRSRRAKYDLTIEPTRALLAERPHLVPTPLATRMALWVSVVAAAIVAAWISVPTR